MLHWSSIFSLLQCKSSFLCLSPRVSIPFWFFLPNVCWIYSLHNLSFISCTLSLVYFIFFQSLHHVHQISSQSLSSLLISGLSPGVEERLRVTGVLRRIPMWPVLIMKVHEQSDLAGCLYKQEIISRISLIILYSEQVMLDMFFLEKLLLLHEGSCFLMMQPFLWQHHTILKQLHDIFNQFIVLYIKPPLGIWEILT